MNTHAEILDEADDLPATMVIDVSQSLAVGLTRAEVDMQIATARTYPRSIKQVASRIRGMATLDEESAEECIYALPRGGKPIKGPSIRFAEILQQSYGNCRAAARVVHVDKVEMYVEAEGIFHDLETNAATSARVRRRISDKRGRLFNDDMIIMTGNAACAIAKRNAILGGVPKPLWRKAYDAVQSTIAGDITTLSEARRLVISKFAIYGKSGEDVIAAMGVSGEEDLTVDHVTILRGMLSTLKNGEATVEEMFGSAREPRRSNHKIVSNPLADDTPTVDPDTGEITEAQQDGPGLDDRAPAEASAKASRERGAGAAPAPDEERPPHSNTGEKMDEGPSPDAPQHASDDGLPTQEESHVDDRATSTLEGDGAAGAASSPQDDEPSVIDEFAAEVAEARSVEQLQQLRQDWKDRIYAAGAQDQARKLCARRSKELAEAAGAEAGR
ncbi:hypothetical protein DLJ53_28855 [Acuticoccus sediminis]|uniref:Uncharacterized protein n=1 Tax=Acuticoccus sediminis TaxID=2184697 RepID=A0A8B2NII7_9HYPH|nr:hypothetical protein [Acuticoccus sediminis]RAH97844.1 hypothetical protein DLJ53_28855 [Acuticoccus sediminis]